MVYDGLITVGYSEMALQVKLVQKVGQTSMSAGVTNHLKEGWQPYGSPYVAYEAAAQVMFLPDDAAPAPDAEYLLVSKYGLVTVGEQIIEKLNDGWNLFGEPFTTQYGPTHAMTKGKFTIFMPNLGFGEGPPGSGGGLSEAEVKALIDTAIAGIELPEEDKWKSYVDKGDEATLQTAGETAINAVEGLRTTMDHNDQVVLDAANSYTDQAIANIPTQPEYDWQVEIDKASVSSFDAAKKYTDDSIAALPAHPDWAGDFERIEENIGEIYNVLNSLPDPQPAIDKAKDEAIAAAKEYTDAVALDTLTLAAGHADQGDTYVLEAANAFTVEEIGKLPAAKDWQPTIDEGDSATIKAAEAFAEAQSDNAVKTLKAFAESLVEAAETASTNLLNETMEAGLLGAKSRWEEGDKAVLDVAQVANNKGTLITPNTFNAGPVAIAASDAGESRTTMSLPSAASVPDGFTQQVLNVTGVAGSTEWAAACRVHCALADYEDGYTVHTSRSVVSNSFVLAEGGFATVVLDKTNKKWFYLGVGTSPNTSKGPTNGRLPVGDLPE